MLAAALIGLACAFALVACGSDESSSPAPDYAKKLAGSPAPLAALHKQGDQVLDGGQDAFDARLEELEGFPKVVNVWGSWCGPCRAEFPHFQEASANLGKRVAFLGVDSQDNTAAAEQFLSDHSVPYPSYADPDRSIASDLGLTGAIPATTFFDSGGEQTFTKFGPYDSTKELEADIQTYAVEGQTS